MFDLISVQVFPTGQEWSSNGDANIISPLTEIKLQNLTCFHREQDPIPPLMGSLSPFLSLHCSSAALFSSFSLIQMEVAAYFEEEKQT